MVAPPNPFFLFFLFIRRVAKKLSANLVVRGKLSRLGRFRKTYHDNPNLQKRLRPRSFYNYSRLDRNHNVPSSFIPGTARDCNHLPSLLALIIRSAGLKNIISNHLFCVRRTTSVNDYGGGPLFSICSAFF